MRFEHTIGGRIVRAECDAGHSTKISGVFGVFQRLHESGQDMVPGLSVRFGWSLLYLTDEGNHLHVNEPDFAQWPETSWNPTLDTTLRVLGEQTRILHLTGADGEDANFDQKIVLSPGAIDDDDVFIRRDSATSEDDSGWAVGRLCDPEALSRGDDLEAIWIAHVVSRRPLLLPPLTLPAGFIVTFRSNMLDTIYDGAGAIRWRQ
jgi:hypothetical protein